MKPKYYPVIGIIIALLVIGVDSFLSFRNSTQIPAFPTPTLIFENRPGSSCVACTYKYGCMKYLEVSPYLIKKGDPCDVRPIDHSQKEDFETFVMALFREDISDVRKKEYFTDQSWNEFTKLRSEFNLTDIYLKNFNTLSKFRSQRQQYSHTDKTTDFKLLLNTDSKEQLIIEIIHQFGDGRALILEWRTYIQKQSE